MQRLVKTLFCRVINGVTTRVVCILSFRVSNFDDSRCIAIKLTILEIFLLSWHITVEGSGQWVSLDSELEMRGAEIVGTKKPTGHSLLIDCRLELPFAWKHSVHRLILVGTSDAADSHRHVEGSGQWVSLDSELEMRGAEIVGTKKPTGHSLLIDCRLELPFVDKFLDNVDIFMDDPLLDKIDKFLDVSQIDNDDEFLDMSLLDIADKFLHDTAKF
ncbi:Phorbol ester/diacylglycerol-binding protein unc-13 [Eufriesea mexicana]|uniref:Phorbol ester/diacylglycerol-binding protein unc-13 n=1 Tax=Eufriesea mexicana TaxID=516756 RepID=A0A310SGJ4_9HYME|nr:Phorbol ester/diacylglycerol-binding protein unc-13 [Eufriesea mexicana]